MRLPLPDRQAALLTHAPNLSLHFDRGYAGYDAKWAHIKADPKKEIVEGKTAFLDAFVRRFKDAKELKPFLLRREAALTSQKTANVDLTSSAPLLVGLGRWNPTETGFNLDRFTACPFIPGSTVKGLLREAARLIADGDLPPRSGEAAGYWKQNLMSTFGRGTEQEETHGENAGSVRFFDAYPLDWPELELDVMTPHYGGYYGGKEPVAADWEDPVPVHFLRVRAGVTFRFWFGPLRQTALDEDAKRQLTTLLEIALDWLGVGAKKSSGYGWFGDLAALGLTTDAGTKAIAPPVKEGSKENRLEWIGATLDYDRGSGTLYAIHGGVKAYLKGNAIQELVPADLLARLKERRRRAPITATVIVIEYGNDRKIAEVRPEGSQPE